MMGLRLFELDVSWFSFDLTSFNLRPSCIYGSKHGADSVILLIALLSWGTELLAFEFCMSLLSTRIKMWSRLSY